MINGMNIFYVSKTGSGLKQSLTFVQSGNKKCYKISCSSNLKNSQNYKKKHLQLF